MKVFLLLLASSCFGQTIINGTFQYPDGTPLNGKVTISLTRSTVTRTCGPALIMTFSPITINIVNGVFASLLTLTPNSCLLPLVPCLAPMTPVAPSKQCVQLYLVKVYNQQNSMIYQTRWNVPNTISADVTQLDLNVQ